MNRPGVPSGSSKGAAAGPGPSTPGDPQQVVDAYRPLAAQVKKSLAPYLPPGLSQPPPLSELLSLDTAAYASRLAGKTFLLSQTQSQADAAGGGSGSGATSSLVRGKKRNRGDPAARKKARDDAESAVREREELGVEGIRRARRRTGGGAVTKRGARIDYDSLKPLYHMHLLYLCNLLNLAPLPRHPLQPQQQQQQQQQQQPSIPLPLPSGLSAESIHAKIIKADFTGLHLSVLASRCQSLAGLSGIVIEETASTFRLVPPDCRVRVVPKDGTQLLLSIPAYAPHIPQEGGDGEPPDPPDMEGYLAACPRLEMTLLGSAFTFRSSERAGRKFRPAQGQDGSGWGLEWVRGEWSETLDLVERQDEYVGEQGKAKKKRGKARRKDPPAWGALQAQ